MTFGQTFASNELCQSMGNYANTKQRGNISILHKFALILSNPHSSNALYPSKAAGIVSPALMYLSLASSACQESMNLISISILFRFKVSRGDSCKVTPLLLAGKHHHPPCLPLCRGCHHPSITSHIPPAGKAGLSRGVTPA